MRNIFPYLGATFALAIGLYACSSDGTSTSSSSTSSGGSSTSSSGDGGGSSSGGATINNCTTFEDHTADKNVDLLFDFDIGNKPIRCSKIKVGSTITWNGVGSVHPLGAKGGDTGSPIPANSTTGPAKIAFPAAGTFGFVCTNHAQMNGAIQVVP